MEQQTIARAEAVIKEKKKDFYSELRMQVNQFIRPENQKGNFKYFFKVWSLYFLYGVTLFAIVKFSTESWLALTFFSFWGVVQAMIGFNVFHDSIHGSLSKNIKVNRIFAFVSCSLIGGARYFWFHKHNILHHQFPNIQGWDDDLETRGSLRLSPAQPWQKKFQFQHFYSPFIYALTTLELIFVKDFVQYFTLKMNPNRKIPKMKLGEHIEFWASKALYFFITIAIPLHYLPLGLFVACFLISHFTLSLGLASIFQLAHVSTLCELPPFSQKQQYIGSDWATHQMATTVNFSIKNTFITELSGGLNYQVEHHLFSDINHTHYPAISKIVQKLAKEYEIPYRCFPTYRLALNGHFQVLKALSKK